VAPTGMNGENEPRARSRICLEDMVILLSLIPLFVLGVFYRRTWWGQVGLAVVLLIVCVVFVIRLRRVHRAFTGRDEDL